MDMSYRNGTLSTPRQKRSSCEACRLRKLRCSGDENGIGCSRCRNLSLNCRFHIKGAPGRPRKRASTAPSVDSQSERFSRTTPNGEPVRVIQRTDLVQLAPNENHLQKRPQHGQREDQQSYGVSPNDTTGACGLPVALSASLLQDLSVSCGIRGLAPTTTNYNPDSLSYELPSRNDLFALLEPGHFSDGGSYNRTVAESTTSDKSVESVSSSCGCSQAVFETLKILKCSPTSHRNVESIRAGTDLVERLLTCPICYDLSRPPRITIQNVLLVGRLIFGITTAYQKYLRWFKDSCNRLGSDNSGETVYLRPAGLDVIDSALSFKISNTKFRELVIHGLQADAQRLSALGRQFALRQLNRHIIGHEACPDADGGCWKEEYSSEDDLDPLDICPHNPAARTLTPCFRIVDVAEAMIKKVIEAVVG